MSGQLPLTPNAGPNMLREWKLACPKSDLGLVFPTGAGNPEAHSHCSPGLVTLIAAGVTTEEEHPTASRSSAPNTHLSAHLPALLRLMVHQQAIGWRLGASRQGCAGAPRSFIDHADDGRLWASVPPRGRFAESAAAEGITIRRQLRQSELDACLMAWFPCYPWQKYSMVAAVVMDLSQADHDLFGCLFEHHSRRIFRTVIC